MSENSKYRLGAMAIKYNVGSDTLVSILKEKGFADVKSNLSYTLTDEQYNYIDKLFAENLELKQRVVELRIEEMTGKIVNLLPILVDMLNLNEKLRNFSHQKFYWKESEIQELVKNYIDSLPKDIYDNIKANNLVKKEVFDEIDSFLIKKVVVKKVERSKGNDDYIFDDGPYCSSCQQAPCMCSDPEKTSMTFWS